MKILILAGGHGTRLWPASVQKKPKQLLKLVGEKTLIENTVERSLGWVQPQDLFLGTTSGLAKSIQSTVPQVPKNHYSLEPVMRDRLAALGLSCLVISHADPKAHVFTMWSDHEIKENQKGYFKKLIQNSEKFLKVNPEAVITVGVKPHYPSTSYGYIEFGLKKKNNLELDLFKLQSFKEKPDQKTAERYLKTKKYLWNTGYFMFSVSHMLELYQKFAPQAWEVLLKIQPYIGTNKQDWAIKKYFKLIPKLDFESTIIEKIHNDIYTIKGDFFWADIGSWKAIKDIQSHSKQNLFKSKNHIDHGSQGALVYNTTNNMIATVKLKDIAIIQTKNTTLIADIHASEEVKHIITQLKENPDLLQFL